MRWLASRFLGAEHQEALGLRTAAVLAKDEATNAAPENRGDTAGPAGAPKFTPSPKATGAKITVRPAAAAITDTPPVVPAKLIGADLGPACNQCGGIMQRTGACYTCPSCGNNTGCG